MQNTSLGLFQLLVFIFIEVEVKIVSNKILIDHCFFINKLILAISYGVNNLNLAFRELDNNDLADIKELSDSMGLLNSPKIGETASAYIHNSECLIYGAFLDDKLVGVGCLTEKTEKFAWIESIRVHGEYQKRGIGTALFNFGEELARSRNFEKIGFQTVTENKGSCRIGELNRFQRGHEMVTFYLKHEHFPNLSEKYKTPTHIDAAEAILFLNKISNGRDMYRLELCTIRKGVL